MQKVDSDYSTNVSRRNSEKMSDDNGSVAETGNDKLRQAKANLSDDIGYVAAGSRRASKYDLY